MKNGTNLIQRIENEISFEKKKTFAEAENYKMLKEIEVNNKKLTKNFIIYNSL